MYITQAVLNRIEQKYGVPHVLRTACLMSRKEFDLLKWSMRRGRAHDVTLFIFDGDRVAVIRKPSYPPGVYRPPSGGVEPGEDFEAGAQREAYEETGLTVRLQKYLLKVYVDFRHGEEVVHWTSHVFTARTVGGQLKPVDTKEIAGARWATVEELKTDLLSALQRSESAGLRYRAELQAATLKTIGRKG
ncbi:MAG: NUDIX hydrolase, partial [Planctomycetota bacterium]